ncbi:MAG: NAD(P)/FAD-dependent oxidoreductase [Bacteroidia bacterium]
MAGTYNYIIVGQGIAGTVMAHSLIALGRSVLVIDNNDPHAASKVAAGIYNPVVPKRLAKSWKADEAFPVMIDFYTDLERLFGDTFFYRKKMIKPFVQEQEKDLWIKKTQEEVGVYLSPEIVYDDLGGVIHNPLGAAEILETGNLDVLTFLDDSRQYLKKNNALLEETFEHALLQITENGISFKEHHAERIIFCEGHRTTLNPWFCKADYRLTKGEVLIIRLPEKEIGFDLLVNKGVFILPLGNGTYKVGATFNWEDLSTETTAKAKAELIEKLKKVLKVPFEIIDQLAGIRPTMNDRRPIIGFHPEHPVLGIFNGLGTKAVMLAPYFARHFVGVLENGHPIDPEVDVRRFQL